MQTWSNKLEGLKVRGLVTTVFEYKTTENTENIKNKIKKIDYDAKLSEIKMK